MSTIQRNHDNPRGINVEKPWTPEEIEEEVLNGDKKGFITSPADSDP